MGKKVLDDAFYPYVIENIFYNSEFLIDISRLI